MTKAKDFYLSLIIVLSATQTNFMNLRALYSKNLSEIFCSIKKEKTYFASPDFTTNFPCPSLSLHIKLAKSKQTGVFIEQFFPN